VENSNKNRNFRQVLEKLGEENIEILGFLHYDIPKKALKYVRYVRTTNVG